MLIDNFKEITNFIQTKDLKFKDFFFLQIIERKKENPSLKENNIIETIHIRDSYDLLKNKDKIIYLCERNNARCYFNVNKRNTSVIASVIAKSFIDIINEKQYCDINNKFNSIIGSTHSENRDSQRYIVDIDTKEESIISKYEELLLKTYKERKSTPKWERINTINGIHLIAKPFDFKLFYTYLDIEQLEHPSVFTDNCTLLYANIK